MANNINSIDQNYRTTATIAGVLMVLMLSGCTHNAVETSSSTKEIFSEGIGAIDDRYIESIDPDKIMLSGLAQLSNIDESLTVTRTTKSVNLVHDGLTVIAHPLPATNNIEDWSALGANILSDARRTSPILPAYSEEEQLNFVFQGLVSGLDRYSRYLTPEIARNSRASREGFGGIGIQIYQVDDNFLVRTIYPNHPAIAAGLLPNDKITHIDDHPTGEMELIDVLNKIRGRVGEPVKLTFIRPGIERPLDRKIVRDYIVAPTVVARQKNDVLEIKLSGFNTGTVGELRRAIVKTARQIGPGLKGLVLDLRSNPGGLLDQAIAVADLFLVRGRIISTRGRHPDSNQVFNASPGEVLPGVPMVVVINGRSASAAEIVAVALRDAGRAAIVGSTSFGKGSVQTIVRLPNHAELNITWARIFAPSGQTLNSQGIVPAICTNVTRKQMAKVLKALASRQKNSVLTEANLRVLSAQPHFSAERRKACLPTDRRRPNDLRTARLLLADQVTYKAATNRHAPTVAKRLPNNSRSQLR